eukprot:gi/632990445/ref/XP_007884171.1/ PREDICTED: calcium homeostasis modulator protein 3 [Callorhinchus milii]
MDRVQLMLRYFQSNSESLMNGICGMLALASVRLYSVLNFSCPCLGRYNAGYGLGVMLVPPAMLFLCGLLVNRHWLLAVEEWRRPQGRRRKNEAVVRYLLAAVTQRALLAPLVWILVTLLDGKCLVCAFSGSVDPARFLDLSETTGLDVAAMLARVPCKDLPLDHLPHNKTFPRKAVARYLRCISQALGWSLLLLLMFLAFLARSLKPCFNHVAFVQTRYWSNFLDLEHKVFEEMCSEHARAFARLCVLGFIRDIQPHFTPPCLNPDLQPAEGPHPEQPEGLLNPDQLNVLLRSWFIARPPPEVRSHPLREAVLPLLPSASSKQSNV